MCILWSVAQLVTLLNEFHARICRLENAKYDMEFEVKKKDFEVHGPSRLLSLKQKDSKQKKQIRKPSPPTSNLPHISPIFLSISFVAQARFESYTKRRQISFFSSIYFWIEHPRTDWPTFCIKQTKNQQGSIGCWLMTKAVTIWDDMAKSHAQDQMMTAFDNSFFLFFLLYIYKCDHHSDIKQYITPPRVCRTSKHLCSFIFHQAAVLHAEA